MRFGALSGLLVLAIACSGKTGASDEAIARYAGTSAPSATDTTASSPIVPVATRAARIALTVDKATGVPDMDPGPGTSDFYVALAYEGQRFRTSVIEGSEAPVWGDSTVFDVRPGGVLEVTLFDEDSLSSDEKLGIQTIVLPDLAVAETRTLEIVYKGERTGTVFMTMTGLARP